MIQTKYGPLHHEYACSFYEDQAIRSCKLEEKNSIDTPFGKLVPKYQITETRTRDRDAVSFYNNGMLKSIYLEEPTKIMTSVGLISCEFLTFYESGTIHRVFPTFGKVGGTWSEAEEIQMTPLIEMKVCGFDIRNKLSCICFYESGSIKSISLYNGEIVCVKVQDKEMEVRFGISFYEDGIVESIEPAVPVLLHTPIGKMIAYDNQPVGIHGDKNSLVFDHEGNIYRITTLETGIKVVDKHKHAIQIQPMSKRSFEDIDEFQMFPIQIEFAEDVLTIIDSDKKMVVFQKEEYRFSTFYNSMYMPNECSHNCSKCQKCGGMDGIV